MLLIIAHPWDEAAQCFYQHCKKENALPVTFINADTLTASFRWKFDINETGAASLQIQLYTGEWIHQKDITGVFNRMQYADCGLWKMAATKEYTYAQQEFYSFFLSWLYALRSKMLNAPTPESLPGMHWHNVVWRKKAGQFGIPSLDYNVSTGKEDEALPDGITGKKIIYAVAGTIIDHAPGLPACHQLAAFLESENIGFASLIFYRHQKVWKLAEIEIAPALFHTAGKCMNALLHHFSQLQYILHDTDSRHTQRATSEIAL